MAPAVGEAIAFTAPVGDGTGVVPGGFVTSPEGGAVAVAWAICAEAAMGSDANDDTITTQAMR